MGCVFLVWLRVCVEELGLGPIRLIRKGCWLICVKLHVKANNFGYRLKKYTRVASICHFQEKNIVHIGVVNWVVGPISMGSLEIKGCI